ncbi:alpha-amylase family protein [Vibrio harveyi]|uniref:alpha-amylase family protein n=1 Tax=Vibrio harveyi TaxID=669 RepID=UPI003BB8168C
MNSAANVYQVFTRLFGNTNTTNQPWGTIEQNGVGKFSDFNDKALTAIQQLGITHIWYTGVPHHAVIRDYSAIGIENDHPAVVKGRAGSPYAVKDYYSVNPDLADDPAHRLEEFEALIERTHAHNMKVIIDIVPNHVARRYRGLNNPVGVRDFGADDDTSAEYHRDNNFYYVPNQAFELPNIPEQFSPLGDPTLIRNLSSFEKLPAFEEFPAKWTGNGSRLAQPQFDDWYETAKINYGVRPDGSKDFPELPADYANKSHAEHLQFWKDKTLPNSWYKFRDIALYWIDKGVDGFRYDMAEMVPVEFWSFMNSSIKAVNPEAFLMAEVYQPHLYRDYIHLGKMDYLYDKVDLYDCLKDVMHSKQHVSKISEIQESIMDIEHHMLHFLDNHDEQRLASPEFAGCAENGLPAMLISTLLSTSPTMVYFGQEVGEAGRENAGFGQPSRTSIFDYIGVPEHQKWMNHGKFDGGLLSQQQKEVRAYYQRLLNLALTSPAKMGGYFDLYPSNQQALGEESFCFARYSSQQLILAVARLRGEQPQNIELVMPSELIKKLELRDGEYILKDAMNRLSPLTLRVENGVGKCQLNIEPQCASAFTLDIDTSIAD